MISPVMPTYARTAHAFVKGEGAWLVDETGRRHLDFGAGIAVNCLGHAHPKLVAALTEQAGQLCIAVYGQVFGPAQHMGSIGEPNLKIGR